MTTNECFLFVAAMTVLGLNCPAQNFVTNRAEADALIQGLKYQHGEISLQNGLATIYVPTNFSYERMAATLQRPAQD